MADKTPPRTPGEKLRTLAQAALNADETVDQLDALMEGMGVSLANLDTTMTGMAGTLKYFEETLVVFNNTLTRLDDLTPRLVSVVDRMDAIVTRLERIVGAGEVVTAPLAATESAVRGVLGAFRRGQ